MIKPLTLTPSCLKFIPSVQMHELSTDMQNLRVDHWLDKVLTHTNPAYKSVVTEPPQVGTPAHEQFIPSEQLHELSTDIRNLRVNHWLDKVLIHMDPEYKSVATEPPQLGTTTYEQFIRDGAEPDSTANIHSPRPIAKTDAGDRTGDGDEPRPPLPASGHTAPDHRLAYLMRNLVELRRSLTRMEREILRRQRKSIG